MVVLSESMSVIDLALRQTFAPTPSVSVSKIASKHLILSPEYSKVSGPVNLDLYPYLVEIMDMTTPNGGPRIVVFQAGIQMGKSVVGQAFLTAGIGYYPGPFLWVTSHDSKAEEFSKTRLDLMIRDSELLRSKVAEEKSRDKSNTIKLKRFPGGTVKLVGAQSVSGLTSDTIRFVVIDEADDHRENVSGAGSSTELAINRTTTFGETAKILIVSSPKVKGQSEIESWRLRGTDRRYLVPCPHCGHEQALEPCDDELRNWRLVWEKGRYDDVHYECVNCGGAWHNNDKAKFLPAGRWSEPTNLAADPGIESYLINFMYQPLGTYSWADFARQWDAAVDRMKAGDLDPIRTLVNTRMARAFEDRGESLDAHELQRLIEPDWDFVPDDVQLITMATDVQGKDGGRFETMWIGWGAGDEAWMLDYVVTPGELTEPETWSAHDRLRARVFDFADGRKAPASVCFIDRGFEATRVLQHTLKRGRARTYAIKGVEGTPRDAIISNIPSRTNLKGVKNAPYYTVRTVAAKDASDAMLRVTNPGPKYLHIPESLLDKVPHLLDMLTAERRLKIKARVSWEKKSKDKANEAWDLLGYNIAARSFACLGGFVFGAKAEPALPPVTGSDLADVVGTAPEPTAEIVKILNNLPPALPSELRPARKKRPKTGWLSKARY